MAGPELFVITGFDCITIFNQVIVAGVPKPEVQWLRDDKELKKGKRVLFEEETVPEGIKYKMTIRDIVMKDFGQVRNCNCNSFIQKRSMLYQKMKRTKKLGFKF
jgi:hypothetical protein